MHRGSGPRRPRTQAAFRAIKAEGGWGGVCTDYAPVVGRLRRDSRGRLGLLERRGHAQPRTDRRRGPRARLAGRYRAAPRWCRIGQRRVALSGGWRRARRPRSRVFGGLAKEMTLADIRRVRGGLRHCRRAGARRRLRHRLRVRRARLPDDPDAVPGDQPAHRRVRRLARQPDATACARPSKRSVTPSVTTARSRYGLLSAAARSCSGSTPTRCSR